MLSLLDHRYCFISEYLLTFHGTEAGRKFFREMQEKFTILFYPGRIFGIWVSFLGNEGTRPTPLATFKLLSTVFKMLMF